VTVMDWSVQRRFGGVNASVIFRRMD